MGKKQENDGLNSEIRHTDNGLRMAALFDLDGVIVDTEGEYSIFWKRIGERYFPQQPTFDIDIKGSTLVEILQRYFGNDQEKIAEIHQGLSELEHAMTYPYIKGVIPFLSKLKEAGILTVVVTSSNREKMAEVWRVHPELRSMFDSVLTAEDFSKSKPNGECYEKAAAKLGVEKQHCVVFEDSRNGLLAGRDAGMQVVGLSTTLPKAEVEGLANSTVDDFSDFDVKNLQQMLSR